MDILRLMVYVQEVEVEKLRDREEYRNKKIKTVNESGQQKGSSSRPKFQKQKGHAPSSVSASSPRNCHYPNRAATGTHTYPPR